MILQANGKEATLARCIAWDDRGPVKEAPICGALIQQGLLFCEKDWKLIPHGIRQAILGEQKRLRSIGAKQASHELVTLLQLAVKQNLDARCAADPELKKRAVDFAEESRRAHNAAQLGLVVPGAERYGLKEPEKK